MPTEFSLLSCGDFDAKALMREAKYKDFFVPNYMKRWINVKKAFPVHLYQEGKAEKKVLDIKKAKPVVSGMTDMLRLAGLELQGRHHSGVDDTINIARCVIQSLTDGHEYIQEHINTLSYDSGIAEVWASQFVENHREKPVPYYESDLVDKEYK